MFWSIFKCLEKVVEITAIMRLNRCRGFKVIDLRFDEKDISMNTSKQQNEKIIEKNYYTPGLPGSYLSPKKLSESLKKEGNSNISINEIRKWLYGKDDYTLQKPPRRNFKRIKVVVSSPFEEFDADLADVSNISKENDDIKFLLIVIDIFTQFLWVQPLRDKTGEKFLLVLKGFFSVRKPIKLVRT